jgi:hypothetical protein
MIEIEEVTGEGLSGWDQEIARFANCRVVHQRAWVEALGAAGYGRPLYLRFSRGGEVLGCLPGLRTAVGPFRVYGSSLPGWQTVSMGPVFDRDQLSTREMLVALVPFLEHHYGVHHIEILSPDLDQDAMVALGFRGEAVPTYRAPLFPGEEDRLMRSLKDNARRNIRRGIRLGLRVRFEEDDCFVDEHYGQLREVYLRGGNVINFSRRRVFELFRRMKDAGHLLAISVYLPDEEVSIASGIFTVYGRELLLWSWAHRTSYRRYYPTELMTWTVMTRAMALGCDTFDLMGRGEFKTKFGATLDEQKRRWVRSRYRWLTVARDAAERGLRWQQSMRGRLAGRASALRNAVAPGAEGTAPPQTDPRAAQPSTLGGKS